MFELLKTDAICKARLGRLSTPHGVVDTPVFMSVGTQGSVKAIDPREEADLVASHTANYELFQTLIGQYVALVFGSSAFGLFQRVPVFPLEAAARSEISLAVVVFPDFMVARFARLAAQRALLEDIALLIAIHLDEPSLLAPVQAIGQNNQYFPLHNCRLPIRRSGTRSVAS
jgi:hypothetical protein